MSLSLPISGPYTKTQGFGRSIFAVEPTMWYYGSTRAQFEWFSGAVLGNNVHPAWDLAAPSGTYLRACESGTVVFAGWAPSPGPEAGGGYIIEVKIHGGMHYLFAHCGGFAVRVGQQVKKGQIIAYLDTSGSASGPHVHWQVFDIDGYGHRRFWNPGLFVAGGAWANDARIAPVAPTQVICLNGPGVNVRSAPKVASQYIYRTSSTSKSTAWPKGYLLCWSGFPGFKFGGLVTGDYYTVGGVKNNIWVKIWLNAGWRYVARPLVTFH